MFSNIFFLVVILLLTNSAAEAFVGWTGFLVGMIVYTLLLGGIYLQTLSSKMRREKLLFIANLELCLFFMLFYFIFEGQSPFFHPSLYPFNRTLLSVFSLILYFGALFIVHMAAEKRMWGPHASNHEAFRPIRFLLPLAIPFLFFVMISDLTNLIPTSDIGTYLGYKDNPAGETIVLLTITLISIAICMTFLPWLMVRVWDCPSLNNLELENKLNAICQRAGFKHGGFKQWGIMKNAFTAAIVGIVPRFRYVMFTQKLLDRLPSEQIEAILAHEIGHSRHKHLLLYPFIFSGMMIVAGLISMLTYEGFAVFFERNHALYPSAIWEMLFPLTILLPFIVVMALYFRFVFGYFSRLFERQADLHVFELGIPSEDMVDALKAVGSYSGHALHEPNWHHHSIKKRMDFLNAAENKPALITTHHRKVFSSLCIFFALWLILVAFLFAPMFAQYPIFHQLNRVLEFTSQKFSDTINPNQQEMERHDH